MKRLLFIMVAALTLSACNRDQVDVPEATDLPSVQEVQDTTDQAADQADTVLDTDNQETVELEMQNESGQSGTATLTQTEDNNVMVTLEMTGGTFTAPQPAHIHLGSCPTPGAVLYPLTNVVNGMSETTLNVTMEELLAGGDELAINVHESAQRSQVYTACGDLK